MKGDKEGALEIMRRLESMGWTKKKVKDKPIYEYKSPDGRWKINYRMISSSEEQIESAGYKVEVTLDVMPLDSLGRPIKKGTKEIKFILLRKKDE